MRLILSGLSACFVLAAAADGYAFEVSSPSVSNGKWDMKYVADKAAGCDGKNVSIEIDWKDPPAGTKSFVLTMYDPDAMPGGIGWWHWQMWNIPAVATGIREGAASPKAKGLPKGTVVGKGDIGRAGYLGPCPPAGSGPHRYVITLFAEKAPTLHTEAGASPTMIFYDAMMGSIGKATVTYTYGK
jgi:Raf kinase inhibitor-like YbhB/YbcL family protein